MPLTNRETTAQYDVLTHTNEIDGEYVNWSIPNEPKVGTQIHPTKEGWVRCPWHTTLQQGGTKESTIVFGAQHANKFREFMDSTPNDLIASDAFGYKGTGLTFGALDLMFTVNQVDGKVGIPFTNAEDSNHTKWSELISFNTPDYTASWTQNWAIDQDRIMSLGILDRNSSFPNPMTGIIPSMPVQQKWDSANMPGGRFGRNVYEHTFWPQSLTSYDQLYNNWNQCGYIKFTDSQPLIPKKGNKDILFVSNSVGVEGYSRFLMRPGRPYELRRDNIRMWGDDSAIIIHLWRS